MHDRDAKLSEPRGRTGLGKGPLMNLLNSPDGGAHGPYSLQELVDALKYAAAPDISVEINQCSSRGTENYNLQTQALSQPRGRGDLPRRRAGARAVPRRGRGRGGAARAGRRRRHRRVPPGPGAYDDERESRAPPDGPQRDLALRGVHRRRGRVARYPEPAHHVRGRVAMGRYGARLNFSF